MTLSGTIRITPRNYLITENYLVPLGPSHQALLLSIGGRSILKRIGLNYGIYIPITSNIDANNKVPFLGITIPINKKLRDLNLTPW